MAQQNQLRFLLSLGNTKIVLVEKDNQLQAYSRHTGTRKANVVPKRVVEALISR